jgi:LacI family transcriptional regulator
LGGRRGGRGGRGRAGRERANGQAAERHAAQPEQAATRDARPLVGVELDTVQPDRARSIWLAVEHLAGHGHRAIGLVNGPLSMVSAVQRAEAFRMALGRLGLEHRPEWEGSGDFRTEGGFAAATELLGRSERPTAVVVANNLMALGTVRAVTQLGLRMPEDLAVGAFDDTEWAPFLASPLTTVAHPTYELGRMAAELLERRFADPARPSVSVFLPPSLVVRDSCGAHVSEAIAP